MDETAKLAQKIVKDGQLYDYTYSTIEEYLRKNLGEIDAFESEYSEIKSDGDVAIHRIKNKNKDYEYCLWQQLKSGEFTYISETDIAIKDVIDDGKEICDFKSMVGTEVDESLRWYISKQCINSKGAYLEDYYPGRKIVTLIYTPEDIRKAINKNDETFNKPFTSKFLAIVSYPTMAYNIKPSRKIVVVGNPMKMDDTYSISVYEGDHCVETIPFEGKTLYQAYYDYMVEKGYYIGQRTGNQK